MVRQSNQSPSELIEAYGEDKVMANLEEGDSLFDLAAKIGVNRSTLDYWLTSNPGRSARARTSRQKSSMALEEKAEKGIKDADGPFELAKAKELAHHYRWAARVRSPATHGDKLETTIQGPDGGPVQISEIKRVIVDSSKPKDGV